MTAEEPWSPEGWAYVGGELLQVAARELRQYDASHPMVTGRCPLCVQEFDRGIRQWCITKDTNLLVSFWTQHSRSLISLGYSVILPILSLSISLDAHW